MYFLNIINFLFATKGKIIINHFGALRFHVFGDRLAGGNIVLIRLSMSFSIFLDLHHWKRGLVSILSLLVFIRMVRDNGMFWFFAEVRWLLSQTIINLISIDNSFRRYLDIR